MRVEVSSACMDKGEIAKVLWKAQMWQIYQNWDGFLLFFEKCGLFCVPSLMTAVGSSQHLWLQA